MKTILCTLALATASVTLYADKLQELNPHRIKFGIFSLDYDHLKKDSIYIGAGSRVHWTYPLKEGHSSYYFASFDARAGYNIPVGQNHTLTPYAAALFTKNYNVKKSQFVKEIAQASVGVLANFRLGPVFSLGINAKGFIPFYQKNIESTYVEEKKDWIETINEEKGRLTFEIGVPLIWNVGDQKEWEIGAEPFYGTLPDTNKTHLVGSRLTLGYRF